MNAEERSISRAFEEMDTIPRSMALRHEQEHSELPFIVSMLGLSNMRSSLDGSA